MVATPPRPSVKAWQVCSGRRTHFNEFMVLVIALMCIGGGVTASAIGCNEARRYAQDQKAYYSSSVVVDDHLVEEVPPLAQEMLVRLPPVGELLLAREQNPLSDQNKGQQTCSNNEPGVGSNTQSGSDASPPGDIPKDQPSSKDTGSQAQGPRVEVSTQTEGSIAQPPKQRLKGQLVSSDTGSAKAQGTSETRSVRGRSRQRRGRRAVRKRSVSTQASNRGDFGTSGVTATLNNAPSGGPPTESAGPTVDGGAQPLIRGLVEYKPENLTVEATNYVPKGLLRQYSNRILQEVKGKIGLVPNDSLHLKMIWHTAMRVSTAHGLRPEQRVVVARFVTSFYHTDSVADRLIQANSIRYHRYRAHWFNRIRRGVRGFFGLSTEEPHALDF